MGVDPAIVEGGASPRVRIEVYWRGPSDWALLGPLVRDTAGESREIEKALAASEHGGSSGPPG